jgi:hypothetical protein
MDMTFDEVTIRCPFCLEGQTVLIETDGGESQFFVSDCEVCCHPMDVSANWSEESQKFKVRVAPSSGFSDS